MVGGGGGQVNASYHPYKERKDAEESQLWRDLVNSAKIRRAAHASRAEEVALAVDRYRTERRSSIRRPCEGMDR